MVRIKEITAGTASRQLPLGYHGLLRELPECEELGASSEGAPHEPPTLPMGQGLIKSKES